MTEEQAKRLARKTFENPFEKGRFCVLAKNLLNKMNESKAFRKPQTGQYVPESFRDAVKSLDRIGQYTDPDGKIIDILIVQLKKESSLDRARTMQRNFIGKYLKGGRGNVFKDGALTAFVSPSVGDWRFSFIKIDYRFDEKGKVKDILTPARRYSFLVGENERSHTAQKYLVPLLLEDNKNPRLEDLEEAFSVEKVTKEFFEKYRSLFLNLKDSLDKVIEGDEKIQADFQSKKITSADFSKKLLGQIVFLYFLQRKGWFGVKRGAAWGTGSKRFLRELFEKRHTISKNMRIIPSDKVRDSSSDRKTQSPPLTKEGRSLSEKTAAREGLKIAESCGFFNNILEPLFYEALAVEHADDYYSRFDCRIPFLNGGLFEPLCGYDWVNTDILLPDSLFSNQSSTKEGRRFDSSCSSLSDGSLPRRPMAQRLSDSSLPRLPDDSLSRLSDGSLLLDGDGILDVFDRYNFTVNEDEPLEKEVAVDPEMLGKVFENLLEVKDRKSKGTYYTPREIVHYMCQESLINYLFSVIPSGTGIQKSDIEAFIKISDSSIEHDTIYQEKQLQKKRKREENIFDLQRKEEGGSGSKRREREGANDRGRYAKSRLPDKIRERASLIDEKLAHIRICDPAVGSGAFPVGMMNEIVRARAALTPFITAGASFDSVIPVKSVIPIRPGIPEESVMARPRQAETPLSAGIRKTAPGFPPDKVERQRSGGQDRGDSRTPYHFKRHAIEHCLYGVDIDPAAVEIAKLRLWLSLVVDEEDRSKVHPLPNLDYKMVQGNSLLGMNKTAGDDGGEGTGTKDWLYEENIKAFHKKKNLYFNETSPSKKQQHKQEIDQFIDTITEGRKIFDFEIYFSEIFQEKQGFDVVIANPPYVDSEEMVREQKGTRKIISQTYNMTKGNWPIYIAFFEQSFKNLNNNGTLVFITPDKWIAKSFGYELRKHTIYNIYAILKAGRKIFPDAKVDAIVSLFSKRSCKNLKIFDFKDSQTANEVQSKTRSKKSKSIIFRNEIDKTIISDPFAFDFIFSNHLQFLIKIETSISGQLVNCENACATSDAYKLKPLIKDISIDQFNSKKHLKIINTGSIGKYTSKWSKSKMTYTGLI